MPDATRTHFRNPSIPPVTAEQLRSVGVDPDDLWFSPTFRTWVFCGETCRIYNAGRAISATTGAIIEALGLTPNPEA